jgi:hypothetical protein
MAQLKRRYIFGPLAGVAAFFLLVGVVLHFVWPHRPTTITNGDQTVTVSAPPNAQKGRPKVEITPADEQFVTDKSAYRLMPKAVTFGPPVDIKVTRGQLAANQVKVTLKLPDGLPQGAYDDAFVAVYEPNLHEWVPLLDSRPDPGRHTVAATAPHFSIYGSFVNVSKKVTKHVINLGEAVTLPWLPLIPALNQAVDEILQEAANNLFNLAPDLKCDEKSDQIQAQVKDLTLGQMFEACAEDYPDKSGRTYIKLVNRFGFPVLFDPPTGFTAGLKDFNYRQGTLAEFITHVVAMTGNQAVAPGPGLAQFTLQPGTKLPSTIEGHLAWQPAVVDMAILLATIWQPETAEGDVVSVTAVREFEVALEAETAGGAFSMDVAIRVIDRVTESHPSDPALENLRMALHVADCAYAHVKEGGADREVLFEGDPLDHLQDKMKVALKIAYECNREKVGERAGSIGQLLEGLAGQLGSFAEVMQLKLAQDVKKVANKDISHVQIGVRKPIADTDQDGRPLPPELVKRVRAIHDAAKRHDYAALQANMNDKFTNEGGESWADVAVSYWRYTGYHKEMDQLAKVLETVPKRWGDETFTYREGKVATGFVYTDRWVFFVHGSSTNPSATTRCWPITPAGWP